MTERKARLSHHRHGHEAAAPEKPAASISAAIAEAVSQEKGHGKERAESIQRRIQEALATYLPTAIPSDAPPEVAELFTQRCRVLTEALRAARSPEEGWKAFAKLGDK